MEYLFSYNTQYSQYINENHITYLYTHLSAHLLIIPSLQSWAYICNSLITYFLEALTISTHNTLEFMCTMQNTHTTHIHIYTELLILLTQCTPGIKLAKHPSQTNIVFDFPLLLINHKSTEMSFSLSTICGNLDTHLFTA